MRFGKTVLFGAMLAIGSAGLLGASPAIAQKKEKAEKNAGPKLSAGFRPNAVEIQKLLDAKNFAAAKTKIEASAASAVEPNDKYYLGNFQLSTAIGLKDEAMQRAAVKAIIASGMAPAAELPRFHFYAGQFALNAKDLDEAITHLKTAADAGYGGASANVLLAEAFFSKAQNNLAGNQFNATGKQIALEGLPYLKRAIQAEKAGGKQVSESWYDRGFRIAVLARSPDLDDWTKMALAANPKPENWRIALRSFQDSHPNLTRDENVDVLRLMLDTKSISGDYSYAELIDAATKTGLLGEVKAVIDSGRAQGHLPTSKFADVYQANNAGIAADRASLPRSEAAAASAANGRVAAATANAYLGYGDHAKAATLYRLALQKGGVNADEINTRLGIALARGGDVAGAKAAFDAVSKTAPARRAIADMWMLHVDTRSAA